MDFVEVTRARRTVGAYTDAKVDDGLIRDALGLSLWAPNHRLTFPIRYVSLGPVVRQRLADLAIELKSARGALSDPQRNAIRNSVLKPSHVIALGRARTDNPAIAHEDYATLACGVQIATTYLWSRGVATKWSTAGWATGDRASAIMNIDPADVHLEGCLIAGMAERIPNPPPRPALDDVWRQSE